MILALIVGMLRQVSLKVAVPLVLIVAALGYAFYRGYSEADRHWQAKENAAIAAEVVKARKAEVAAEGVANGLQLQNEALNKKVADYEAIVSKVPAGNICRLTAADLRSLRKLRER